MLCQELFIRVQDGEEECVRLAAEDLEKDLDRVSPERSPRYVIAIGTRLPGFAFDKPEEFYAVRHCDGITITGSDAQGTMWGIYTFSREILGIDPCYLFHGTTATKRRIAVPDKLRLHDRPETFTYRGWFLNDEDYLSGFVSSGKFRNLAYPFYHEILDSSVLEMVLETALRLRINTIIPASFLNILNPWEEQLVALAARRGFYVSQHHIEPLGVSFFTMENELGSAFRYSRDLPKLEVLWRRSAEKWAKYPRVIWQLGLRGRGDKAIWNSDSTIGQDEALHGRIIGDALRRQTDILKELYGNKPFIATMTLWMESAFLYQRGLLEIPENTILVFADVGPNQMLQEDFYQTKLRHGQNCGVYYHAAYWRMGPHSAEGCHPQKALRCYRDLTKAGVKALSILNVSNVREFTRSVSMNAAMTWNMDRFDLNEFLRDYWVRLCGKDLSDLDLAYHNAMPDMGQEDLAQFFGHHFHLHKYGSLPFAVHPMTDGSVFCYYRELFPLETARAVKKTPQERAFPPEKAAPLLRQAAEAMQALQKSIRSRMKNEENQAVRSTLEQRAFLMEQLYLWIEQLCRAYLTYREGTPREAERLYWDSFRFLRKMRDERQSYLPPALKAWYRGDDKNLPQRQIDEAGLRWPPRSLR